MTTPLAPRDRRSEPRGSFRRGFIAGAALAISGPYYAKLIWEALNG